MHARRLPRIIPLALTYLVPFAHLVSTGPFDPQLWDLGAVEEVSSGQHLWDDASTDLSFFWPEPQDPTSEYGDLLFAGNDPCHADADLWEWDSYSKIRRRQACDANDDPALDDPALGLPTLFRLTDSDKNTINVEKLRKDFNIPPPSVGSGVGEDDSLCPPGITFKSNIPVCDSGLVKNIISLGASSTLYDIQLCWFPSPNSPFPATTHLPWDEFMLTGKQITRHAFIHLYYGVARR
jgi:hypothetical protein